MNEILIEKNEELRAEIQMLKAKKEAANGQLKIKGKHLLGLQVKVIPSRREASKMAFTNFVLTVAGVSAVILLMRTDVKQSASIFKRNVRQIRHWLEEESASAT
ncbi:hypothetical protein RJ639_008640, partial [Escallonia herrerae]